jgi:hypothetical protein
MRLSSIGLAFAGVWCACSIGCGSAPPSRPAQAAKASTDSARITQFYATAPNLAKGEKELLCYGVENARTVKLAPSSEDLSAALSRCVEVNPEATTRYTLTAEGVNGPPATQELTVTVGPPHVKIIDVTVNSLSVTRGTPVSLCYRVENAASVEIDPIRFRGGVDSHGCGTDTPKQTTTYIVTARGVEGSRDQERVTVQVH